MSKLSLKDINDVIECYNKLVKDKKDKKSPAPVKKDKKNDPTKYIKNPKTGRMVLKDSQLGKKIQKEMNSKNSVPLSKRLKNGK